MPVGCRYVRYRMRQLFGLGREEIYRIGAVMFIQGNVYGHATCDAVCAVLLQVMRTSNHCVTLRVILATLRHAAPHAPPPKPMQLQPAGDCCETTCQPENPLFIQFDPTSGATSSPTTSPTATSTGYLSTHEMPTVPSVLPLAASTVHGWASDDLLFAPLSSSCQSKGGKRAAPKPDNSNTRPSVSW